MVKMFKEKVFKNKRLMRWASLAFAVVLVVTVAPYIQSAWGGDNVGTGSSTADISVPIGQADLGNDPQDDSVKQGAKDPEGSTEDGGAVTFSGGDISVQNENINQINWSADGKTGEIVTGGRVTQDLNFSGGEYTLEVNGTLIGQIKVQKGTTLNLKGEGTIQGNGQGSVIVVSGNKAKLILNEDKKKAASGQGLTILGGKGSNYNDLDKEIFSGNTKTAGGGILVKRENKADQASLIMYNGTIGATSDSAKYQGNTAQAGGGIFVDRNCSFTMHNGAILGNTASKHEGGGIFVACGAAINKGLIKNNISKTNTDWGGGGIFIESKGVLSIPEAVITGNTAKGLGGGISGCPHANMGIGEVKTTVAIYNNTAQKNNKWLTGALYDMPEFLMKNYPTSYPNLNKVPVDRRVGDIVAYDKDAANFSANDAMDYYCIKGSIINGGTVTWQGRVAYYEKQTDFGDQYGNGVTIGKGDIYPVTGASLGLTATLQVNESDLNNVAVRIVGNTSWEHGGGIGCNGTLTLGDPKSTESTKDGWSIKLKKEIVKLDGSSVSASKNTYRFGLYSKMDLTEEPLKTASTNENGEIVFSMSGYAPGTYKFYAHEIVPAEKDKYIDYDTRWREITVTVRERTTQATVGLVTDKVTTRYVVDSETVYQVEDDDNGFKSQYDGKVGNTFSNKVQEDKQTKHEGLGQVAFFKQYNDVQGNSILNDKNEDAAKKTFTFEMYPANADGTAADESNGAIAVANNAIDSFTEPDGKGKIVFNFKYDSNADTPQKSPVAGSDPSDTVLFNMFDSNNSGREVTVFVKEKPTAANQPGQTAFDEEWHKVKLTFGVSGNTEKSGTDLQPVVTTIYTASVTKTEYGSNGNQFTNYLEPKKTDEKNGSGDLTLYKSYFGPGENNNVLANGSIEDKDKTFKFAMYASVDGKGEVADETNGPIAVAYNDPSSGEIKFHFDNTNDGNELQKNEATNNILINMYPDDKNLTQGRDLVVFVKELKDESASNEQTRYDESLHKITLRFSVNQPEQRWDGTTLLPIDTTVYTASLPEGNIKFEENGEVFVNTVEAKDENEKFGSGELVLNKKFLSGNNTEIIGNDAIAYDSKTFNFEMFRADGQNPDEANGPIAVASSDANGNIKFTFQNTNDGNELQKNDVTNSVLVNMYPNEEDLEQPRNLTVFIKEKVTEEDRVANPQVTYDEAWHKVELQFTKSSTERVDDPTSLTPTHVITYTASLSDQNQTVEVKDNVQNGGTIENKFRPEGQLPLSVSKYFYGDTANATGKFSFTMQRVKAPVDGKLDLSTAAMERMTYQAVNQAFEDGVAPVAFEPIIFTEVTSDDDGYWYMISENDAEGAMTDARYYVVKITVAMADDGMSLIPSVAEIYYADGVTKKDGFLGIGASEYLELNKLDDISGQPMYFGNFDSGMMTMSLYGYAINAASNEPIDQQCFVDPKIIKNLEGRSLTEGEFNFKLIELKADANGNVDWSQTQGQTISETSNDRYGMVDFDKANNVSGDLENPSCLAYTVPGTYYYRVVEANESADPSVEYSKQIITFTTVIELNDQGQLECTDMYYGHVENGENVRYEESADANWHPDMYNYAKGMDLQVRKTSALDRDHGLEGATYGLYAVNDGDQADIFIQEATSDADGWITYKNVSLKPGTLYYFKEREAPAGHTVSEFRSAYFYLTEDKTAPNGYAMYYTDDKIDLGVQAEESAIMVMSDDEGITTQADSTPIGPMSESGNMLLTFARDGGVYDEATTVDFNKLDTRTHEWVEGAKLQILEKNGGKVIDSWVSGKAPEKLQGKLNVDTEYILREIEAPEGYAKADDVVFKIGQYGAVEIVSGTSNGNAEINGETITLYDTMLDGENIITREVPGDEGEDGEGTFLAKTGDILKIAGIVILAIAAICGIVFAVRRRNKSQA